eukprot:scaffold63911_cov31-Tisochrysis_lutea.AAC.1
MHLVNIGNRAMPSRAAISGSPSVCRRRARPEKREGRRPPLTTVPAPPDPESHKSTTASRRSSAVELAHKREVGEGRAEEEVN